MIRKRIEEVDDEGRRTTTVVEEPEEEVIERAHGPASILATVLNNLALWVGLAGLVVFVLLAFRLGFEMGAANPNNDFVDFIYDVSGPLVEPFDGIAEERSVEGGGVFRPETAVAIGVYLIATALVIAGLRALAATAVTAEEPPRRTRMVRGH